MYGLSGLGVSNEAMAQRQPTEQEVKERKLLQSFQNHQYFIQSQSKPLADLVQSGVVTVEEARELLDIDGFKALVVQVKELQQ